jgi:hypothetical protein
MFLATLPPCPEPLPVPNGAAVSGTYVSGGYSGWPMLCMRFLWGVPCRSIPSASLCASIDTGVRFLQLVFETIDFVSVS